jgi:Ran GTPase-activating protein (RanGAP) involved in mRNA processing and transport
LSNRGLHVPAAMLVASLIPATSVLKNCNLLKNSFDVESAKKLTKMGSEKGIMLSGMTRDQKVANFPGQSLQPADAILITSDLKFMAVVTTVDLGDNHFGVEGAKAIAEALKVNAVVTTLYLGRNNIGNDGAKAIAEALKVNAVLTTLWLNSNSIGDDGANAIAEALKVNAVLTILDVEHNRIGDKGAKAFAEALKVNAVLTELWLIHRSYMMGNAGKTAVQDAVKGRRRFVLGLF